jgi:acetyl-CoA carboxylase carboxyl transferase subunit beta
MAQPRIDVSIENKGSSGTGPGDGRKHPNTCPSCGSHYREDELERHLGVCPQCGYHFPLSAPERIEQLADPGSFAEEETDLRSTDPLGFFDLRPYTERLAEAELKTGEGDAIMIGRAEIEGEPCQLSVMDFAFMGGSMGSVVGEKFVRACERAVDRRVPLVSVTASGGARMQESALSLMQMAKTSAALARLDDAKQLFISLLADPTTGGVTASFAMLGDFIIAEPKALIGFAGPRTIWNTIKVELPDGFQRSEFLKDHGFLDFVVHRKDLRNEIARLMDYCENKPRPA